MDKLPLYLVAMIVAIAKMPLDIYDVHAWNLGTVKAEPWRGRSAALIHRARAAYAWLTALWCSPTLRQSAAVCLLLLALHTMGADAQAMPLLGVSGIVVSSREAQIETEKLAALDKAKTAMIAAEKENRELTKEERESINAHLATAKELQSKLDVFAGDREARALIDKLGIKTAPSAGDPPKVPIRKSIGQQFVESAAMEWILKSKGLRGTAWSSPTEELEMGATTLDESSGSGGKLIITDNRPGITPILFKRLVVADLIAPGTTDSASITYMKETTFTNAAAPVAEGAAKPESTLVFDLVTDAVRKIAHWLPVTDEMLEDVAQIRSYIDARLRLGVQLAEDDQLLNGSGTPPAIQGLLNRTGLATAVARGSDSNADAIFKQIMAIFTSAFLMPDGIVLNPANWTTVALAKDANGNYYGNGPFNQPPTPTLWGLPIALTPTIASGTSLVGAYQQAAQIFRKGGLRVEASNSHSDFFVKNLTAIRAEERLALAVYRPGAFGTVTGLV